MERPAAGVAASAAAVVVVEVLAAADRNIPTEEAGATQAVHEACSKTSSARESHTVTAEEEEGMLKREGVEQRTANAFAVAAAVESARAGAEAIGHTAGA